jgi:glyoxylase-like metal-dependent hydrolase (beta-lactamase superfamily II)
MRALSDGIYYEDAYAGVTLGAIILEQGTILIDAPLRAEDARTWKSSLLNQSRGTHRLMINLDGHYDRTIGSRALECVILSHRETAEAFRNRPAVFKGQVPESSAEWGNHPDVIGSRWAHPNITLTERLEIHWGEPEIIIEHHPGPTSGALWVLIPDEKIVFVGDTITLSQPPYLDQADLPAWVESLDLLLKARFRNYIIVSGRGGPTDAKAVREQRKLLKKIHRDLERLFDKNTNPQSTSDLIPSILRSIEYSPDLENYYTQRLRYGLHQYYTNHYFPTQSKDDE